MRVIQLRDGSSFPLKAFSKALGGDLDRDSPVQPRVQCAEYLSHATRTDLLFELVWSKAGVGRGCLQGNGSRAIFGFPGGFVQ